MSLIASFFILLSINMAASPTPESKILEGVVGTIDQKSIPLQENVLQKHAAFFDLNRDGVIYPWETYQGLREIGNGIFLSIGLTLFYQFGHQSETQNTRPGKFPSPLFPIEVKNIQLSKHGSDSGVYDTEGRFVPSRFEEIFTKHARTHPNALTNDELKGMIKANREPNDLKGRIGSLVEWNLLYKLAKDKEGLLQKETIRAVYDGSLFELLKKDTPQRKTNDSTFIS